MTFLNFTIQDPSPLIVYSPNQWVEGTSTNNSFAKNYSGGTFKSTNAADATAKLSFLGTSVTIFGAKRPFHGNYSAAADGNPQFVGDGNDNNTFQFALWNAQNLKNAQHHVVITNIPTKQGDTFDIDFISIGRELGPPGFTGQIFNATVDDVSPFVVYSDGWTNHAGVLPSNAFNSTLHSTTQQGSNVTVSFQGSSIELYGLYLNAPFQVMLDQTIPVSLAGPNVDLSTGLQHPQTLLFLADNLNETIRHSVTLINSVSDINRPLYFDFAIVRSSQNFSGNTPSPNPDFAIPAPGMSSPSASKSKSKTGTIVGGVLGGIAGLVILAFIGFLLHRLRSRRHTKKKAIITPPSSPTFSENRSNEISPFIVPNNPHPRPTKDTRNLNPTSQEGSFTRPAASTSQQDSAITGSSSNQPQAYIPQEEEDAGRLTSPPRYNDKWLGAASQ